MGNGDGWNRNQGPSRPVGRVDLDEVRVLRDLRALENDYGAGYAEYASGVWESLMLFNRRGDSLDVLSEEYSGAAQATELAEKAPYLCHLVEQHFDTAWLKSARLFRVADYGLIVPHTDYGEFREGFLRLHLVLKTHPGAFAAEGNVAFRMQAGELWFLNGHRPHSAGTLAVEERVHLVLDFDPREPVERVVKSGVREGAEGLQVQVLDRQELSARELEAVLGLGSLLTPFTCGAILDLLQRLHAVRRLPVARGYRLLMKMAHLSGDPAMVRRAYQVRRAFLGS